MDVKRKNFILGCPGWGNYFTLIPLPDIPDLRFYDTANNIWGIIPVMPDPNCRRIEFDFLQRLPDQNLGFVESCLLYNTNEEVRAIREMDVSTGKLKTLIEPSWDIKEMGPFSFSPNRSELIQEDMADHILSNKLFYRKDGTLIQIVPNFIRAMHPSWSLIDRQIAFLGTQSYPGKKPQELKTLNDIAKLALYPWDLYISTPEGTNLKKFLSAVQDVFLVKWSPKEDAIAFSGMYEKVPGLWLIDLKTSKVTRVWSKTGETDLFDWSPDGRKIVVVNSDLDKNSKVIAQKINIIYLDNE